MGCGWLWVKEFLFLAGEVVISLRSSLVEGGTRPGALVVFNVLCNGTVVIAVELIGHHSSGNDFVEVCF